MNPFCIKIIDINRSKTVSLHFLDMCLTSADGGAMAAYIFSSIEEKFDKYGSTWENCVSLGVDNANTIVGKKNSVASRFLQRKDKVFTSQPVTPMMILVSTSQSMCKMF